MARLRQLQMVRRQLRFARSWQPVPIFYALVVGAAAVPGLVLAVLTRRRWIALAVPVGAFVGRFLLSVRSLLEPHNREFVREVLDPIGTHRRQVAVEIAALRREGHRFPVVVPADWDGYVRLHGIGLHRRAPDVPLRSVGILAGPADDNGHHPRLRIQALTPDDASVEDELAEQVAHTEAPPEDITARGGRRLRTPVGRDDDDSLVFQMPDPSPERVTELQQSWRDATLLVDGEPLSSRLLVGRRLQVATVDLDGRVLEITGHDVDLDGLRLQRVSDLESWISDFERSRLGDG